MCLLDPQWIILSGRHFICGGQGKTPKKLGRNNAFFHSTIIVSLSFARRLLLSCRIMVGHDKYELGRMRRWINVGLMLGRHRRHWVASTAICKHVRHYAGPELKEHWVNVSYSTQFVFVIYLSSHLRLRHWQLCNDTISSQRSFVILINDRNLPILWRILLHTAFHHC